MNYINAADFNSLSEAIQAAAHRRLYIPYDVGGKHTEPGWFAPDANGWKLDNPIEIFGDGVIGEDVGLRFFADPMVPQLYGTENSTIFTLAAPHIYLHDLVLSNNRGYRQGTGIGIRQAPNTTFWGHILERIGILYAGKHGIELAPGGGQFPVGTQMDHVTVYGAGGDGIVIDNSTTIHMNHVTSVRNRGRGIVISNSCTMELVDCVAEWGDEEPNDTPPGSAAIRIDNSSAVSLKVHVEQFARGGMTKAVELANCAAVKVEPSGLFDYHSKTGLIGVSLRNSRNCVVEPQMIDGVEYSVHATSDCSNNVIFPQPRGKVNVSRWRNRIL